MMVCECYVVAKFDNEVVGRFMNFRLKIITIMVIVCSVQFMQASESDWYSSFMSNFDTVKKSWPASWNSSRRYAIHPIDINTVTAKKTSPEVLSVRTGITHEESYDEDSSRCGDVSLDGMNLEEPTDNSSETAYRLATCAAAQYINKNAQGTVKNTVKSKKSATVAPAQHVAGSKKVSPKAVFVEIDFKFARSNWSDACKKLKMNIDMVDAAGLGLVKKGSAFNYHPNIHTNKEFAWQEFNKALTAVLDLMRHGKLGQQVLWVDGKPDASFYDLSQKVFAPYVQKLDLNEGQKVIFHGDIHGDIHSFIHELDALAAEGYFIGDTFELADKNNYLVFLGDYVDRGHYGSEVMYTLLRLQLANPYNVIMVRGNHEDQILSDYYGFGRELIATFGPDASRYDKIYRLYNFMPVALYVGSENDYLQCCHGGIEYGYKPQALLQSDKIFHSLKNKLDRADFIKYLQHKNKFHYVSYLQDVGELFHNITISSPTGQDGILGFMWFDFLKIGSSQWKNGRGLAADKNLTQMALRYQSHGSAKQVRGIVRAHQHATSLDQIDPLNLMKELIDSRGFYKQWRPVETSKVRTLHDGIVWTLNVAPDGAYGKGCGFEFGSYTILTIGYRYEDWKFEVFNTDLY